MNWNPSAKFLAGSAHMGWGAAAIVAALHHGVEVWLAVGVLTVYTLVKEYWADRFWLERDTLTGSTFDAATYEIGAGIGVLGFQALWCGLAVSAFILIVMVALDFAGFFSLFQKR